MASIKQQSPAINYPQLGQLGFRMPQSEPPQPQLDWHHDPFAIQFRKFVIKSIEIYLTQNAPPTYGPEIVVLAAELEDLLFKSAVHKEDYMDQGKLYNRLRCLVHSKWLRTKKSEEANDNITSLPTYTAPQYIGMLNGHGANWNKSLSEQVMAASTCINTYCSDNLKQPRCVTDFPRRAYLEPQKGACEVTLPEPKQVIPSKCFSGKGCPGREAVDSGPSFSGSVLQYDSEASFESHHVNAGCSTEGDLNPMMTSSQSSPSVHTPSTAIEDTKLEFCSGSTDILQPVAEPFQFEQQSHDLIQLKCSGGSCSCKSNSCPAQSCSTNGPGASVCTEGGGQPGICSTARNGFELMPCTNDCSNDVSPECYDDTTNPSKRRKLDPVQRSSSSIGQQQPDSPSVVNSDNLGGNKKVVIVAAGNSLALDDLGGNSPQHQSAALKHVESELATPDSLEDMDADTCCTRPSDCAPNVANLNNTADSEEFSTGKDIVETTPDNCSQLTSAGLKKKVGGISLTEYFSLAEIGQHISSLRQKVDQCALEEVDGKCVNFSNENYCQLCGMDKIAFPPMPIYCSLCSSRIKNYAAYYSTRDENRAQTCFCTPCHNKSRGSSITCCGMSPINKIDLVMKKHNLVTEESWVQCDLCEGWQHQICALFNDKRDLGGKAEYVCPKCYMKDLDAGLRMPLPRSAACDAINLPQTKLSNHIEQWLYRRLKQEREDRAKVAGNILEEVPEAADLVVRVVSSVDKTVKVKQEFLNLFPEKNYPAEFPYKSKVILLFQRIEGVDVCLFAMYVQEYGSECSPPNQRCVYISYLDSVKYFRPEIKTLDGNALRTFVYHEILIGYMDYCKSRGFAMCYIWACPPGKGEDYILYCHPDTQKTPKTDKLRTWYQGMLKKATKENVVVSYTNFYEKYFVPTGEDNTKVTAARLPSFEGDYWSGVAETVIQKFEQQDKPLKAKKMTKRSMKAMGFIDPSAAEVKDMLLMQDLAQAMSSSKDDFIIAYLQPVCTHCHEVILSGKRWFCSQCKNYQSCERCHDLNLNSEQGYMHISSNGQRHALTEETIDYIPADTDDHDTQIGNCFLEIRQNLLSFCQGNHYQFDTLRRAKHSSSMILYHLHRPNESNVGTSCSLCLKDIGNDVQWKCETCPEFSVCGLCYYRNNVGCHIHALVRDLPIASNGNARSSTKIVRDLLDVVLHASRCQRTAKLRCTYPNCILIRKLFAHAHLCTVRVTGGCPLCKKTWIALMLHSRKCEDINCGVPRCMDLKKYTERLELRRTTQLILEGDSEPAVAVAVNR